MHDDYLLIILADIINGYSLVKIDNKNAYIKHINLQLELESNLIYKNLYDEYKLKGLPTKQEKLNFLIEEGLWSKEEDSFIDKNTQYLENLKKTKSKLVIKAQVEEITKLIKDLEIKLEEKINKKNELLGATCEKYAEEKKFEYKIINSIYKDKDLLELFYSNEDIDYLELSKLRELFNAYYKCHENFSEENLKKICLIPLFFNYFSLLPKENIYKIFKKNILEFSFFQQKLIHYCKNIKNIFESVPDIPEQIQNDYDSLISFSTKNNSKNNTKKSNAGYTMVGAKKEDMQNAGINTQNAISPFDILKTSGKTSLNKKDFLNIIE
jgi:hypothetical protein